MTTFLCEELQNAYYLTRPVVVCEESTMPDERGWLAKLVAELDELGCRRVIVVGARAQVERRDLRAALAHGGRLVFTPPAREQVWLDELLAGELAVGEPAPATVERFSVFMADGLEHGVEAVVLLHAGLAQLCKAANLAVPIIA
jgi:aspartate/glutamate racemase